MTSRGIASLVILSNGFRPFFLFAGVFALTGIGLWLPEYYGEIEIQTAFSPIAWHAHEMIYGYLAAAMTGFLLTAIPNWTGRLPIRGWPLALLVSIWIGGRIAVAISAQIGWIPAMIVDCAFLSTVVGVTAREVWAGKNIKNLKVVALVFVLLLGNIVFHLEARWHDSVDYGIRTGLSAMVMLVMVIGGRIIPSFTRNWLARQPAGRMPVPFNRFDVATIGISAIALAVWIIAPTGSITDFLLSIAGFVQLVRLFRWAGDRTWRDRLVLILHAAYLFVPVGFFLLAASDVFAISPSAGIHAWTIGGMTTLTLAVMTRATLGHTGRALNANPATQLIYGLIVVAAIMRIAASIGFAQADVFLQISVLAWAGAFVVFLLTYGPMQLQRKLS